MTNDERKGGFRFELEYYDAPVDWTVRANPDGLVDEFVEWVEEEG
jgi:hypothetical protein